MNRYEGMLGVAFVILLQGCALLTPVKSEKTTYMIDQMPSRILAVRQQSLSLVVLPPETAAVYNTTKMAYSLQPHQIAYYSQNQWGSTPPQMLLPLLMGTIQNTHYFQGVISPPVAGENILILKTQLLELMQDYSAKPAVFRMKLRATLMNSVSNKVITSARFDSNVPIKQQTPYAGVIAANQATTQILQNLSQWLIKSH